MSSLFHETAFQVSSPGFYNDAQNKQNICSIFSPFQFSSSEVHIIFLETTLINNVLLQIKLPTPRIGQITIYDIGTWLLQSPKSDSLKSFETNSFFKKRMRS